MEQTQIQSIEKEATLESGDVVTVQADTISIPQPDQTINKNQLIQDVYFLTAEIQVKQEELNKKQELLSLWN